MTLYIGLMSGTSMDGIDAALIDLPSNKLIAGTIKKYSLEVRQRINDLVAGSTVSLASICQLNTLIGREFAFKQWNFLMNQKYLHQRLKP